MATLTYLNEISIAVLVVAAAVIVGLWWGLDEGQRFIYQQKTNLGLMLPCQEYEITTGSQ